MTEAPSPRWGRGQRTDSAARAASVAGHLRLVTVFSVAIFYWAMATRLPREEMLLLVNRQAEHGEEPEVPRH